MNNIPEHDDIATFSLDQQDHKSKVSSKYRFRTGVRQNIDAGNNEKDHRTFTCISVPADHDQKRNAGEDEGCVGSADSLRDEDKNRVCDFILETELQRYGEMKNCRYTFRDRGQLSQLMLRVFQETVHKFRLRGNEPFQLSFDEDRRIAGDTKLRTDESLHCWTTAVGLPYK